MIPAALVLALLALAAPGEGGGGSGAAPAPREAVVLVHGLGRTQYSLRKLHAALEAKGYLAIDWPYASWRGPFESHAARLAKDLERLAATPGVSRVHAVGHSLGCVLIRAALLDARPAKFGRVVQLVPPNHGARVARFLSPVLGRLFPVLPQLSDDPASAVNRLGVPRDVEIGVVAARYDHLVTLESTHLAGEKDHFLAEASHSFLMNRDDVIAATIAFLRGGTFR